MKSQTVLLLSALTAITLLTGGCAPVHAQNCGEVVDSDTLKYDEKNWVPLDEDAVFFYNPQQFGPIPKPRIGANLREAYPPERCANPVRLKLVDYIDATKEDHGFTDVRTPHEGFTLEQYKPNPPSRILNINGIDYRVTPPPKDGFDMHWFRYSINIPDVEPGAPYLLVAEMPNDIERYTSMSLSFPKDAEWAEPYAGYETQPVNCQSGNCMYPGVGLTIYTGREFPLDRDPFYPSYFFYPRSTETHLTFATTGWYRTKTEESGAAVSKVWVFKVLDDLGDHAAEVHAPKVAASEQRRMGIYMPHPWYLFGHYGIPANTEEMRAQALNQMADQLQFSGINWLEFNAINGSDRSGVAWYSDSSYFGMLEADLLKELPPVAEAHDIDLMPVITSLLIPLHMGDLPAEGETDKWGFSRDSMLFKKDGVSYAKAFNSRHANPLRPEVQDWLIRFVDEIAVRTKDEPSVKGVAFRVNGKIGLGFSADQDVIDSEEHEKTLLGAKEVGYGQWTLSQFKQDTDIDVPMEPGAAYPWLKARPEMWEKWLDWRCQKIYEFWTKVRDRVVEHNPDWTLYIKTVLPSELPGTSIEWEEGYTALELLRHHGYDPSLYVNEKNMVIEQTMMIDQDRYYTRERWGPPFGSYSDHFKNFYYQPELMTDYYKTAEGEAVEFYHSYMELAFHPDVEFGWGPGGFRTDTGTAKGRFYFEPMTWAVRLGNPQTLVQMGWQIPTLGQEARLRRWSQAWRALPYTEPQEIAARIDPASERAWVRQMGDRIAVVNDTMKGQAISVFLDEPLPEGHVLRDVVTREVLIPEKGGNREQFSVELLEFDLRTLEVDPPVDLAK